MTRLKTTDTFQTFSINRHGDFSVKLQGHNFLDFFRCDIRDQRTKLHQKSALPLWSSEVVVRCYTPAAGLRQAMKIVRYLPRGRIFFDRQLAVAILTDVTVCVVYCLSCLHCVVNDLVKPTGKFVWTSSWQNRVVTLLSDFWLWFNCHPPLWQHMQ